MSSEAPFLGACPRCEAPVPSGGSLITYRRNGQGAGYAECPSCGKVVGFERAKDGSRIRNESN